MNSQRQALCGARFAVGVLAVCLAISTPVSVSAQAATFAEGLTNPAGIYVDDAGYLWVTSHGTGNADGGIYVISPEGEVHSFVTGLPSTMIMGEPSGPHHAYFNNDVELIVVQGEGVGNVSESIVVFDTTGFTPGDDPLTPDDATLVVNIGNFVDGELGTIDGSNPFAMTFVPNSGQVYLVDSKANAIVGGLDGILSMLTQFPKVQNTGSEGPPTVDAVPTGIEYFDGTIYVGTLTGFPFNEGAASILAVDSEGGISTYLDDLTTVVDLQVIPGGGGVVFLEHRFAPNAGILYKYENEQLTEMATGLDRPVGVRLGHRGEAYVSLLAKGEIVVVEGVVTDTERELPEQARPLRAQAYPNPFSDGVNLSVDVRQAGPARLEIVDVLGRRVYNEDFARLEAGTQRLRWNATGSKLTPGTYLYRIEVAGSLADGIVVKQ